MSQVSSIEIRCLHCGKWFPSPIFFGDSESFDTSTLIGNQAQCPHCGRMTGCNKENIRLRHEQGGFVGIDT
jgi:DNA-directed RNA polymerase subunit RPC12/RpoP